MKDPLSRSNGQSILRLFDVCFKRGVIDARNMCDDYAVSEFVSKHKYRFTFGVIGEPEDIEWRSYRFVLYGWARGNGCSSIAENYVIMIRRLNYLWCLLPYCMWFYLMGAQEWLSFPDSSRIELFKMENRIHWDPNNPVKKFKRMDYVSHLHEAALAYRRIDEEKRPVAAGVMDSFCQAVYDITR